MRSAPALLLCLAACTVHTRTEQRWAGRLTPTTPRPECTPSQATLSIRDAIVTFAPDEGTWVLTGKAAGEVVTATRDHPTPDHKLYRTTLQATRSATAITGTYTTPICSFHVDLHPSNE